MIKKLLIVFAKNKIKGKVKTRLSVDIGDENALKVYDYLYEMTAHQTAKLSEVQIHIYFTDFIDDETWPNASYFIQSGENLGEKMESAFLHGFKLGFDHIVGIGTDLPDLTVELINEAFSELKDHDFVFGPAEDGGYYLIGLKNVNSTYVFKDKPWSGSQLLNVTIEEILSQEQRIAKLSHLNDIDTLDDLKRSKLNFDFL